jgi:predicted nucleotidyltransferase
MRLDLDAIFKRKVDLVTRRALEQTQNGLLRERILKTAKVIFADNEAVYAEG